MKYILSIVTIFLYASQIEAQVTAQQLDSLRQPLQTEMQKTDSLTLKYSNKFQTLLHADSLGKKAFSHADSTKEKITNAENKIQRKEQSLDSIKNEKLAHVDSAIVKINNTEQVILNKKDTYQDSLNGMTGKYQSLMQKKTATFVGSVDSLKTTLQHNKFSGKLDSVNNLKSISTEKLEKPQAEVQKAQGKIQEVQSSATGKVDEKLSLLSQQTEGQGNLPGNLNLPNTNLGTGKIIPGNVKIPDSKIDKTIPALGQPLNQPSLPGNLLDAKVDGKMDLPKRLETIDPKELSKVKDIDAAGKSLKNTNELSNVSNKAKGYSSDVKNIEKGNLDKVKTLKEDAIAKSPVKDELAEIQKQDQLVKAQQAKLQSYKNPEEYKRQALARSKQLAAIQMVAFEKQIKETISQVSKYQSTLGTVLSKTSEMSKKRDKLKHLRMYEKFVPGVTLQVIKPGAWIIDINPSLRYRLTSYWSVGAGWNERTILGKNSQSYDQTRVYGIRSFTEVVIFKGISIRLDAEKMNTVYTTIPQLQDEGKRIWVWSYMAGIKKDFSFIPKVNGNVQFMYTIYATNFNNPYPTRFNVRLGFDYMAKKRLKKKK